MTVVSDNTMLSICHSTLLNSSRLISWGFWPASSSSRCADTDTHTHTHTLAFVCRRSTSSESMSASVRVCMQVCLCVCVCVLAQLLSEKLIYKSSFTQSCHPKLKTSFRRIYSSPFNERKQRAKALKMPYGEQIQSQHEIIKIDHMLY